MPLNLVTLPESVSKAGFEDLIERHGRTGAPKIYPADQAGLPKTKRKGEFYTRTTTFIDVLDDKTSLADWKCRMTLVGVAARDALLDKVRGVVDLEDPESKRVLNETAKRAQEAANSDVKRDVGTALHEITEMLDQGKDPGFVPPDFEDDVDAFNRATAFLEVVGIEEFCVQDEFKVAGTFDRLYLYHRAGECDHDQWVCKPRLVIGDLKTGSLYGIGKFALQFAAYAHMQRYNPETFERTPLTHEGIEVDQDIALLVHLPAGKGKCDVYEVDIRKGWEGMSLAAQVREWRNYWGRKANQPRLVASS